MAQTERGIVYPDDYSKVADVPADMQAMAESIDDIIGTMEENVNEELENRVEKEEGKDLSSNDFDDTYKENVDDNTEARHTHSNKSILDLMTAYYTAEEKEKLAELENYDDTDLSERVTTAEGKIEDIEAEQTEQNTAITNNENNIETLQEENKRLKQTLVTTTGTGENITLNKTAEMDFVVPPLPEGNTKQNTTEGYNLINEDNLQIFNNNRYIRTVDNYYIDVKPNTSYTLSIKIFAGDGKFVEYNENNETLKETSIYSILTNGYITITTTADTKKIKFYAQMYQTAPSTTPSKYDAKCLLVEGSYTAQTLPAYEPYTNGVSPNPSYPQEVQVVKGDVEVKVENINILNPYTMFENQINSGLIQIQNDGKIILNGTVDYNNRDLKKTKLKAGTYYGIEKKLIVHFFWDGYDGYLQRGTYTLAEDKEIQGYLQNGTYDNVELQPMICIGTYDANKSYTPHQEQTLPLTLGDIELCKIGDYKDYFYKDNSKWYLHKEIGKAVLDGTETWQRDGTNTTDNYRFSTGAIGSLVLKPSSSSEIANALCNKFKITNADFNYLKRDGIAISNTGRLYVYYDSLKESTLSQFLEWLSLNNITLYYALEDPTDIEITDTTLINQLEAIYNAISYYEQTNISGTSSGISPLFDVEAYQNTKLLLENALDRLELLES